MKKINATKRKRCTVSKQKENFKDKRLMSREKKKKKENRKGKNEISLRLDFYVRKE